MGKAGKPGLLPASVPILVGMVGTGVIMPAKCSKIRVALKWQQPHNQVCVALYQPAYHRRASSII